MRNKEQRTKNHPKYDIHSDVSTRVETMEMLKNCTGIFQLWCEVDGLNLVEKQVMIDKQNSIKEDFNT